MIGTNSNDKVQADIRDNKIKQGFLIKQSRILKEWKDRWMVLTKTHLYSFEKKGVYKNPTEMIPLKEVQTLKAYFKDQYKPFTFRVQSKQVNLHMSCKSEDQKWAWMTAIEKITERLIHPQTNPDTHNLIRQTLRMSTAVRQTIQKKNRKQSSNQIPGDLFKKLKLGIKSQTVKFSFEPLISEKNNKQQKSTPVRQTIEQQTFFKLHKMQEKTQKQDEKKQNKQQGKQNNKFAKKQQKPTEQAQKVCQPVIQYRQKIVQKIVEVPVQKVVIKQIKVSQIKQVIVQKQKIIYKNQQNSSSSLENTLNYLLGHQTQNPKPILEFAIYLLTSGPERYHQDIIHFCLHGQKKTLFCQYLILLINQQIEQNKLNSYLRFLIIIYQNSEDEYFYTSDFKVFIDILLREMQLNRSQFNQYLIMMIFKTMADKVWWKKHNHRRNDIKMLVKQLESVSGPENKFLAGEVLEKL